MTGRITEALRGLISLKRQLLSVDLSKFSVSVIQKTINLPLINCNFCQVRGVYATENLGSTDYFIHRSRAGELTGIMRVASGDGYLKVVALQGLGEGAGTQLMQAAVQESLMRGFGGRLKLNALVDAIPFYQGLNPALFIPGAGNQFTWNRAKALALLRFR